MSHLNEGCILVFDSWYSGFRILNSTTNAGTLPYINPQAARKAYEAHKVYSVTRLKMELARDQAGSRVVTVLSLTPDMVQRVRARMLLRFVGRVFTNPREHPAQVDQAFAVHRSSVLTCSLPIVRRVNP